MDLIEQDSSPPTAAEQIAVVKGKLGEEEFWVALDARTLPSPAVNQGNAPILAHAPTREELMEVMAEKDLPPVFTDNPRWPVA